MSRAAPSPRRCPASADEIIATLSVVAAQRNQGWPPAATFTGFSLRRSWDSRRWNGPPRRRRRRDFHFTKKKKKSWERTCARQSRSSSRLPSWPAKQFCRRAPATGTTASDEPAAGCPQRLSAADGRRRSDGTAVFAGQPASAPRFTFRRRTTERQRRSLESNPLSRKGPRGSNILVTENNDRVKSAAAAAAAAKENRCRRDRF